MERKEGGEEEERGRGLGKKVTILNKDLICFCIFKLKLLAVHYSSIGDLVPWSVGRLGTTNNQSLHITDRLVTYETFDQSDEDT